MQHSSVLYNIALAQVSLARHEAAVATLQRYLGEPKNEQSATQRKAAQALLDRLLATAKKAAPATPVTTPPSAATAQLTVVVFPYGVDRWPARGRFTADQDRGGWLASCERRAEQPDQSAQITLEPGGTRRAVLAWARKDLVQAEPAAVSGSTAP